MGASARFSLPLLAAGQAQKEAVHNEAVQLLDFLAAAAVEDVPGATPPGAPQVGATYIVGEGATEGWAGQDNSLAGYSAAGWRFISPRDGMLAYVVSQSTWALYRGGAWEIGAVRGDKLVIAGQQVVGPRAAMIAAPTGGATVDAQSRTAIAQILSALQTHGLIGS
ncbi:DUF2793 domain-containing protein [Sphingomonas sp.]|uniref:DUF2793 domain-containing protein n=1 Tax=Sphingomonas sp. TaxID=28214 RepID=UPI0025D1A040|nr:DUF2793 domain-containing protein [Sphingomonas sp.]MBV9529260.1 DUF2793 domain-containing protein [Sphingomonas sp.]